MNKKSYIPIVLRDRAHYLCRTMKEVSGFDPAEDSRRRPVVTARVFVCYVLMREGYSENDIGIVLGWDHSTVNHYRKKMRTFMESPGYKPEKELWKKFKKAI